MYYIIFKYLEFPIFDGQCYILLQEPTLCIVAEALVHWQVTMAHNMPIREDQVKVNVKVVLQEEKDACVSFPSDEVLKLGDAKGCFILWPKELVSQTVTTSSVRHYFKL